MSIFYIVTLLAISAQGLPAPRLVYPRLLQERSTEGKMVVHIHDSLTLNLEQASVAAPEVHVHAQEDGNPVQHVYKGSDINRNLYEDEHHMASVSLMHDGRSLQMEGLVGPNSRIAPLPGIERSSDGLAAHMIYEIEQRDAANAALSMDMNESDRRIAARYDGNSRRMPDRVTIEVFIVADSAHQRHFTRRELLLSYLCVLLNAVNLRFRSMTTPKVTLMLTGFQQSWTEPYWRGQGKYMHDTSTLKAFKEYAGGKWQSFHSPDIIFLLTGRDVYSQSNGHKTTGLAYVGGLCNAFLVGLGEDDAGYYSGVHTVAHEIGHLLGATHDGDGPERNIPNHPTARDCSFYHGYLMSYVNKGPQHHFFSKCSLRQMRFVIRERGPRCWRILSGRKCANSNYPGTMIAADKFCRSIYPNQRNVTAKMINPKGNECKMRCQYPEVSVYNHGGYSYQYTTIHYTDTEALDFSRCGQGMVCIQGHCVYPPRREK
ncbi:hypothetical protein V5799_011594 [Amblyomma americanum]|uniref:Peptidase M12B domain-containing protein n=1 Tax=Amblyomma americanum TaxID=6943 RepID=A0AAQ4EHD9_AMBAM